MGYSNSARYTLKYVAAMLDEDDDFLRECSIEMFSEDGCLCAYDDYPASELSEHIILFTQVGIENLQQIIRNLRGIGDPPSKPVEERSRKSPGYCGPDRMVTALQPTIPHLTRSSLHRCLHRHGISRLLDVEGDKEPKKTFKSYPIGYFHIDIAEVRTAEGKLDLCRD